MSRIGRKPINVPSGVTVDITADNTVTVKGPKGTLTQTLRPEMTVRKEGDAVLVERPSDEKLYRSLHGLTRTLVANMVEGVTSGFSKELEINGVGYKAAKQGKTLVLNVGHSHAINIPEPAGIVIDVPNPNKIVVTGADKQAVGQLAAEIRSKRPPEPYLGKGIKYADERIRRKAGKAGKNRKGSDIQLCLLVQTATNSVLRDIRGSEPRYPAQRSVRAFPCIVPSRTFTFRSLTILSEEHWCQLPA